MDDDEGEKSFCYIEGTSIDKQAVEEVSELHENVWYRMKPPKLAHVPHVPYVSARQIDLVRNMLLGKTALKSDAKQDSPLPDDLADSCDPPPRRDFVMPPNFEMKKSSLKFLSDKIFD